MEWLKQPTQQPMDRRKRGNNIITITLGDELSGTIARAVEADVTVTPQQADQATTPAATREKNEETKEMSK